MIFSFLSLLFSLVLAANTDSSNKFILDEVNVNCAGGDRCDFVSSRYKNLTGEYRGLVHLKETLKVMASDGGYQFFSFKLERLPDKTLLSINLKLKPILREISVKILDRDIEIDPLQVIIFREGDFFEAQKLKDNSQYLDQKLLDMGFPSSQHSYEIVEKNGEISLSVKIKLGRPKIFKKIRVKSNSVFIKDYLYRKFLGFYKHPFDINAFRLYLEEAQKELFHFGYYLLNLDFNPIQKNNKVILDINVLQDQLFAFNFKNLKREHRNIIHNLVIDLFRKYKKTPSEAMLINALKEHYQFKSLLDSEIKVDTTKYVNKSNETVYLYQIYLNEKSKTLLSQVIFKGGEFFSEKKLQKMFKKEAFELASIGYFDKEYFNYFQEFLRNKYIENGFVQVKIFDPVIAINKKKKTARVEYTIQEGPRTLIQNITFLGVPEELESKLFTVMKLRSGGPFNPIQLSSDIKILTDYIQEQGYFYAEILNANDKDFVLYDKSGSQVDINFKINTGPLVRLNRVLYLGNNRTKKKIISKKVTILKGELITPSKTNEIQSTLSSTGLFNSVSVTPVRHNSKNTSTDLLIKVSERDYGLVEIAPGYRTDLGIKLTGTISYQNIGGYNRSISLRSQLNRRTSFTTIDPERSDHLRHIIEHNTSFNYTQDDLFDSDIDGSASVAYQTRRFYAFDANILRLTGTLSKDLSRKLSTSLRYQYEDITQYDATEEINNGSFRIGSLTPGLTLDLRNNQINATKGAFFNLSCEFANPYFFSQKESNLEINYYKLISRTRFYLPFKNGTLAFSLVGGVQENLARDKMSSNGEVKTVGYVPTIKVFRLAGMDIIRGFTDEEMNRLPSGEDISEVRVDNRAYLANLKVEPRFFLNDSLMAGMFYDAGRVFVNQVNFGELRDSVGLTFKVVTPVGTLDFDYGIKLLRKKDASGRLEDPGRFHVSIGFF